MPHHITIELSDEIYEILERIATHEKATPETIAKETLNRTVMLYHKRVSQYANAYEESLSREGSNPWVPRCFPEECPIEHLL